MVTFTFTLVKIFSTLHTTEFSKMKEKKKVKLPEEAGFQFYRLQKTQQVKSHVSTCRSWTVLLLSSCREQETWFPVSILRGYKQQLSADRNFAPKMKNIWSKFPLKQLSTYVAIIVIFIHNNVLDKDLQCSCKKPTRDCVFYMTLPFFIVFVLQLWTDRTFQRTWTYTCKFFWVLLYHIIKAAFIGLLWVVSVLIDGHWYVCCQNDQSYEQKYLACKAKNEITAVEQQIITELKNESWVSFSCFISMMPVSSCYSFILLWCYQELMFDSRCALCCTCTGCSVVVSGFKAAERGFLKNHYHILHLLRQKFLKVHQPETINWCSGNWSKMLFLSFCGDNKTTFIASFSDYWHLSSLWYPLCGCLNVIVWKALF